ncbi:MAG: FMN-binding negative transcriptional regulator [Propionibacteriaceae bacterium]
MYIKRSFAMAEAEAFDLLRRVQAANFITMTADGLVSSMLPWVVDESRGEHGALLTHIMRVNPQWRDAQGEALVIADGLNHLVSADWLPVGNQVPTWNYETVHVWGKVIVHDDEQWCREVVTRTVADYEETWRVETSGQDITKMLRAIVGIELQITRIEAKAKLSQNRHPDVIKQIIAGLEAKGLHEDAELLRTRSLPQATQRQAIVDELAARGR